MKINIQKIAVMGASFLAVLSIVLAGMIPTYAATFSGAINPNDYISNIVISGDTKRVTFDFSSITPRYVLWEYYNDGTSNKSVSNGSVSMFNLDYGLYRFYSMTFPLGVETYKENLRKDGSIDVSDISHGAELLFTASWELETSYISNNAAGGNTGDKAAVALVRSYAMLFDSDGIYISSVRSTTKTIDLPNRSSYVFNVDTDTELIIPSGCRYVVPFYEVQITDFAEASSQWRINLRNAHFGFTTDINMIYDNSETMKDIENAIGDLNDNIQDTNDKLDDVNQSIQDNNDKLDDIISGGDAAVDAEDDYNKLEQGSQAIQDAMDDHNEAEEKLPKPPTSASDIVSDDTDQAVDDALETAGQLFDWEASGLNNMYVPMGLSVSLSTLFYIIFGKQG